MLLQWKKRRFRKGRRWEEKGKGRVGKGRAGEARAFKAWAAVPGEKSAKSFAARPRTSFAQRSRE